MNLIVGNTYNIKGFGDGWRYSGGSREAGHSFDRKGESLLIGSAIAQHLVRSETPLRVGHVYDLGLGPMILERIEYWPLKYFLSDQKSTLFEASEDVMRDALAAQRAKRLMADGWHCISGKYLKVARAFSFFHGRVMPNVRPEYLRDCVKRRTENVEVMTIDVDTYVALKKLRRGMKPPMSPRAEVAEARAAVEEYRNATNKTLLQVYQQSLVDALGRGFGALNLPRGAGKSATRPPRRRPSPEQRYISGLVALPDSLYKRTQLRVMSLPDPARRDHEARRKAFDREVKKFLQEKQP